MTAYHQQLIQWLPKSTNGMFPIAQVAMDGRQTLSTQDAMTKDLQSPLLWLGGISSVAIPMFLGLATLSASVSP
jgi:hypothetical protein